MCKLGVKPHINPLSQIAKNWFYSFQRKQSKKFALFLKGMCIHVIHSFNIIGHLLYFGNSNGHGMTTKARFGSLPKGKEFIV